MKTRTNKKTTDFWHDFFKAYNSINIEDLSRIAMIASRYQVASIVVRRIMDFKGPDRAELLAVAQKERDDAEDALWQSGLGDWMIPIITSARGLA